MMGATYLTAYEEMLARRSWRFSAYKKMIGFRPHQIAAMRGFIGNNNPTNGGLL